MMVGGVVGALVEMVMVCILFEWYEMGWFGSGWLGVMDMCIGGKEDLGRSRGDL
jgi:hypothetical protein